MFAVNKYQMDITTKLINIKESLSPFRFTLVAVSKTKPVALLHEAYNAGIRIFGENKVQEMVEKEAVLPKDIQWHFIGHLQTNKVRLIAPFVNLIHAVDSLKLLKEIDRQGKKNNRIIRCLLQIHIAEETSKFGFSYGEVTDLLSNEELQMLSHVSIVGLMGMATNTPNEDIVRKEFSELNSYFDLEKSKTQYQNVELKELSMGMSSDHHIALEEGSTMIRIGSNIFGTRN
ncbi:MAG: YggS family pyridoxal phosphate-dependent enzyme [Cyclobacteriaceae bacterium]